MPELPEVETMCRGIACFQGETIQTTHFPRYTRRASPIQPRPKILASKLHGARITDIKRLGKRAVLSVTPANQEDSLFLIFEPRMTGLLLRVPPPTKTHVRLIVKFKNSKQPLIFWDRRGLGTINLINKSTFISRLGSHAIGPDALTISGPELYVKIHHSKRHIKVALLDQKVLAGIGNIYASEILYAAKIDPRTRCNRLSKEACARIVKACSQILYHAIEQEGSSIGDETYRTADNRPGRYQHLHKVYGRNKYKCSKCKNEIKRVIQTQRSTFFCSHCQTRY
jgi:formamidopyrimidine-DNA glycosylase